MKLTQRVYEARRRLRRSRADDGFGLLEVMIALTVLLVVLVPMAYLITSVTQVATQTRQRVAATGVAEHWLSYLNDLPLSKFPNIPSDYRPSDTTVAGTIYHTSVALQWAEAGLNGDLCTPGSTPQVVAATATVSWGKLTDAATHSYANSVSSATVLNPPYGALSPTDGYLAIQVDNASGKGLTYDTNQGGIVATFSPSPFPNGSTQVQVPQGGCLFVTAPQGSYSVTLSSSGWDSPYTYVDNRNENPTPSSATILQVAESATTAYTFQYDRAGQIHLAYASQTSLADGFACPDNGPCFAWGRGANGADLVSVDKGVASTVTLPTDVMAINGVSCLPNGTCVLVGVGTNGGVVLSDSGGAVTELSSPVASTDLTGVACSNGSTCYAVGTDGTNKAVLVSISGSTVTSELPSQSNTVITSLDHIICTSANQCFATGAGATSSVNGSTTTTVATGIILTTTSGSGSWAFQGVPSGVTDVSAVGCFPVSGSNPPLCAAGATASGAQTMLETTDTGATWTAATTFPSGVTTIGPIVCVSAQSCLAATQSVPSSGAMTSTVLATGDGGQTWAATSSLPADLAVVTGMTCPTATSCVISGTGGSAAGTAVATESSGTWTWSTTVLAASLLSGVGCTSTTTCLTTGESPTGPVAFVSTDGGSTWAPAPSSSNFSSLKWDGAAVTGLPITVSNSGLSATGTVTSSGTPTYQAAPYVSATTPDPTAIGNLFPYTSTFYNVWAGDAGCSAEEPTLSLEPVTVNSASASSDTVPLQYLRVRAVGQSGDPVSGVQLSVTVTNSGCNGDVFNLPSTAGDGTSEAGVPVGNGLSFTLTATDTAANVTATVPITMSSFGVADGSNGITYPYPLAVPITLNVP